MQGEQSGGKPTRSQKFGRSLLEAHLGMSLSTSDKPTPFAHADTDASLIAFAEETPRSIAKKHFIVGTLDQIWARHCRTSRVDRHLQEIIREGRPCHLYYDLEYPTDSNPTVDGNALVDALISFTCEKLRVVYNIDCQRSMIIELDSTTKLKFSRHLVFRIPNVAFRDNRHMGLFVEGIAGELLASQLPQHTSFMLNKSDGERTFFVDVSVYSKNRHFRMYGSCKPEKDNTLLLSPRSAYPLAKPLSDGPEDMNREVFDASLIAVMPGHQRRLRLLEFVPSSLLKNFTEPLPDEAWETEIDWDAVDQLEREHAEPFTVTTVNKQPTTASRHVPGVLAQLRGGPQYSSQGPSQEGFGLSPYPAIDAFVTSILANDSPPGRIRKWMKFDESRTFIYEVADSHYCDQIKRNHKSNGLTH